MYVLLINRIILIHYVFTQEPRGAMASDQSIKLHSLLRILKEINSGTRLTPAELAKLLEVTERTIYRYIIALQSAGYPIYFDRKRNSYCFTDGYKLADQNQSNELYQALDLKSRMFGELSAGLLSYDHSGQCVVANNAAALIIGGSREQLLSLNYNNLESWRSSGLLVLAKKVMASGMEARGDFHIYTSFNMDVWLYCSMSRFEQNGKPYLMFAFQDITVRKQAERKLEELAEQFRVLANTTMDAFWIVDEDGVILDVNGRTSIVYGYTKEEMLGKHVKDITKDQDAEVVDERISRIIEDGYYRFESSHQTKNGSTILVEVSAARIPNTQRFLAFIKDITKRKEAEQKTLQERDEKYRLLFETMAQGVVFQQADGRISSANPAAGRILGLSLEQMQGKTSMDPGWRTIRVDGTELSGHDHPSMIALRTGKPVFDYVLGVFNPKKGTHSWLSVTAIPLFQPGAVAPYQVYTIFSVVKELQNNGTS